MREDQILPHLAALAILLTGDSGEPGPGSEGLAQLTGSASTAALIDRLRAEGPVLTYDPDGRTLSASNPGALAVVVSRLARDRGESTRRCRRLDAGDERACA